MSLFEKGPMRSNVREILTAHPQFRHLAHIVTHNEFPEVSDADFLIRNDGVIFNIEGWHHPIGGIVAEAMYIPDTNGSKNIFGVPYRKATLYPGTYTPVPYSDRAAILGSYDSSLDQTKTNPFYAKYKQIIPRQDFFAHFSGRDVFRRLAQVQSYDTNHFARDIMDAQAMLGLDLHGYEIGLTGAPLLGSIKNVHDVDIVFSANVAANLSLANAMRSLVKSNPEIRVIEGGKGWGIRYLNTVGSLMCNFFSYKNPEDAPLRDFTMEVIEPDVRIEAIVNDDAHTVYTPTVLGLSKVRLLEQGGLNKTRNLSDKMKLVVYHTASRGECFEGNRITAQGAYVNIATPKGDYNAICVIEREGVRNLTPIWPGYYIDDI